MINTRTTIVLPEDIYMSLKIRAVQQKVPLRKLITDIMSRELNQPSQTKRADQQVPDIMDLAGSLHKYAIKNKSIAEIRELERAAVADAVVDRYVKTLKKTSSPRSQ